jgi:hypothetical protein
LKDEGGLMTDYLAFFIESNTTIPITQEALDLALAGGRNTLVSRFADTIYLKAHQSIEDFRDNSAFDSLFLPLIQGNIPEFPGRDVGIIHLARKYFLGTIFLADLSARLTAAEIMVRDAALAGLLPLEVVTENGGRVLNPIADRYIISAVEIQSNNYDLVERSFKKFNVAQYG